MNRNNAENLHWAMGMVNGIAYALPTDKEEVKQALHAVATVIGKVLRNEEKDNEQRADRGDV